MILTDREIRFSIENGMIGLTPTPSDDAYSSTSIDLKLGPELRVFKTPTTGIRQTIDPAAPGYSFPRVMSVITENHSIGNEGFTLDPNKLVLGWTRESVSLNPAARVAARVEGKSSLARLGLAIHITAPTIHAGFAGQIQLEIINLGSHPILLRVDMNICQLIFENTLGVAEKGYRGQFANQTAK